MHRDRFGSDPGVSSWMALNRTKVPRSTHEFTDAPTTRPTMVWSVPPISSTPVHNDLTDLTAVGRPDTASFPGTSQLPACRRPRATGSLICRTAAVG